MYTLKFCRISTCAPYSFPLFFISPCLCVSTLKHPQKRRLAHVCFACFVIHTPATAAHHLKGEGVTSRSDNGSLDSSSCNLGVCVRNGLEGTSKSLVSLASEVVSGGNGVSGISAVERLGRSDKDVVLDKDLSALAGVDAVSASVVVVVEDVASSESQ